MQCNRCQHLIPRLNLSEESRILLWCMVRQDLRLFAVKYLMEQENYAHIEAKLIIAHFNKEVGQCHRCAFSELEGEQVICPRCKAFNYNFRNSSSFNEAFCSYLEYQLDFDTLDNKDVRGFWCDGIDPIPNDPTCLVKHRIAISKKD